MENIWLRFTGKLGLDEDSHQKLVDYTAFKTQVIANLTLMIKEMSGAQASDQEREVFERLLPSIKDSPHEFEGKVKTLQGMLEDRIQRNMGTLKTGEISPVQRTPVDFSESQTPGVLEDSVKKVAAIFDPDDKLTQSQVKNLSNEDFMLYANAIEGQDAKSRSQSEWKFLEAEWNRRGLSGT